MRGLITTLKSEESGDELHTPWGVCRTLRVCLSGYSVMKNSPPTLDQRQLLQGIGAFILARSTPILDLDDRRNGGSGFLLSFDDRYFVATAEHVIRNDHQYAILMREPSGRFIDVTAKHTDVQRDVGILQLDAESIDELLRRGHCFLGAEHLYIGRYPHIRLPVRVTGFPSDKETREVKGRRISSTTTIHRIAYGSLNFDTFALPQHRWPRLSPESRKIRRAHDIFCSWDPDDKGTQLNLENLLDEPIMRRFGEMTLSGISGGGIWMPYEDTSNGNIYTPAALLVGVQTSYSEGGRRKWLRGSRTKSLIQLLEKHYPGMVSKAAM